MTNLLAIPPHTACLETRPPVGRKVGYTGRAYWGPDFDSHGHISCCLEITEHTADGFYALPWIYEDDAQECGRLELFVLLDGREGRQTFHGYHLLKGRGA
jgi:hypothetical protein